MNKILYTLLTLVAAISFISCDDVETYAEQRDAERSAISNYIKKNKIKVIKEQEFRDNGYKTDVSKNEYVLLNATGVYMQIVHPGNGEILKENERTCVFVRFDEWNINGDSLQLSNNNLTYHYRYDKFDVRNVSGSFFANFDSSTSLLCMAYNLSGNGVASVPSGWLVPLSYIKLGTGFEEGTDHELAEVNIIVPHDYGHAYASQGVYACHYHLTYQREL